MRGDDGERGRPEGEARVRSVMTQFRTTMALIKSETNRKTRQLMFREKQDAKQRNRTEEALAQFNEMVDRMMGLVDD